MSAPHRATLGPLDRLLDSRLIAALTSPRHVDAYLELVDPLWSLRECRARIVGVRRETPDMVTLELAPNSRFPGYSAGEWVTLTASVNGSRVTRCFSLASAPSGGGSLELSIRVRPDGALTHWVGNGAKVDDIVLLGMPEGEFVLPSDLPERLTLISGGSGITPCMSILREVIARSLTTQVTFVHFARTYEDVPFLQELRAIAAKASHVKLVLVMTRCEPEGSDLSGHATPALLGSLDAASAEGHVYVCGPMGLVDAVSDHFAPLVADGRLHVERFTAPVRAQLPLSTDNSPRRIAFLKSGVIASGDGSLPLLMEAEAAGLSPTHGCRMGICQSCRCTKTAGVVRDVITGELLDESVTDIRICISTPVTDVTLDL